VRSTPLPTRSAAWMWLSPTPGSPPADRFACSRWRSWQRVIEINLLGVMYTDRAALPHLERSRGYLLNIASAAAVFRGPGMSAYCAAKAGVEALSDCLRVEEDPYGVDVGCAYFLFLDTDMVRDAEREMPRMEAARDKIPKLFGQTYPLAPAIDEVVAADRRAAAASRLPEVGPTAAAAQAAVRVPVVRTPGRQGGPGGDARVRADHGGAGARTPRPRPSGRAR